MSYVIDLNKYEATIQIIKRVCYVLDECPRKMVDYAAECIENTEHDDFANTCYSFVVHSCNNYTLIKEKLEAIMNAMREEIQSARDVGSKIDSTI